MSSSPDSLQPPPNAAPPASASGPQASTPPSRDKAVHEVTFITYPKLLFIWPLILAGFVFWPLASPPAGSATTDAAAPAVAGSPAGQGAQPGQVAAPTSPRLGVLGWVYVWITVIVLLTLGVDIDRNHAAFWVVAFIALWLLGLWLHDVKHFTLFGNIYRWFADMHLQYHRNFGLAVSCLLIVPYLLMLVWGRFNDRWRITHNEFEHSSFGRQDDSLGRGAKTIRTSYPDVLEVVLGLAGTLVVYNAMGTRELRRIPHVTFLPFVRKRLNQILEVTSVTAAQAEDEEEENGEDPGS